jgi:hypothetical protein
MGHAKQQWRSDTVVGSDFGALVPQRTAALEQMPSNELPLMPCMLTEQQPCGLNDVLCAV